MRREKIKGFISGVIFCCLIFGFTMNVFATPATKALNVIYNNIKLVVDGFPVEFGNDSGGNVIEPFIYNGTTYLPVRAVAEALEKSVDWDGKTQTVYIGNKNSDLEILSIINNSKTLSDTEVKNYIKKIIEVFSQTMWGQWDWRFRFSDDFQNKMIVVETTYKEKLILPWHEHPIYEGFKKAEEEMRNSGKVSKEELEYLSNYIDGYKIEHEDSMKQIMEFGEAPPLKIFIDTSSDGRDTLYIKGYYKEDRTYVNELIELEKWLEHKTMTESKRIDISNEAYEILYRELDNIRNTNNS